jgi:hypothetical protein
VSRTLLLIDGSVAGLVALAIEAERGVRDAQPAVVWAADLQSHLGEDDVPAARSAIHAQAATYGLECVQAPMLVAPGRASEQSEALLRAAHEAASLGCRRIVWAVQYPYEGSEPNLDLIASTVDRAMLVSRLASLDVWDQAEVMVPEVRVETPFVDFSDEQLADLAVDLSVTIASAWWHTGTSPQAIASRERWQPVLAGLVAPAAVQPA